MTLEKSSAASREADVWSPFILATKDFCDTIKPHTTQGTIYRYLRRVEPVPSSNRDRGLVLAPLSPFEANRRLMPEIRQSEYVRLHARMSKRVKPSDNRMLCATPPLPPDWTSPWALIDQLDTFAGQLYLRLYSSYRYLCRFLGVPMEELPNTPRVRWNLSNLFSNVEDTRTMFSYSPLPFMVALLAIRTKGRPFAHTHMGKILQDEVLTEKNFEQPRSLVSGSEHIPPSPMDNDPPDVPGPLILYPPSKRMWDPGTETPESDLEPFQKRQRLDG